MSYNKHTHALLIKYHKDLSDIDSDFKHKAYKIPLDLPPYAHLSRLNLLNDSANDQRKMTSEMLIKDLNTLELAKRMTWLSLGILVGSLIGILIM